MKKTRQIYVLLLTALYLFYFAGTHFFVHSHFINERIVVHSHPYANSNHTHNTLEIQLIDVISNDTCTADNTIQVSSPLYMGHWTFAIDRAPSIVVDHAATRRLRAPPYPAC